MRRSQALRGIKDYELALKDLIEAGKLFPGDKDVERLTKLTNEDIELEQRIRKIMGNSELLKGKEYIDFLLDFLQGKKDDAPPPQQQDQKFCFHELTAEESAKLKGTLSADKDIAYYFNVRNGFKVLVDSLHYNTNALEIIQSLLDNDAKLQEDF